MEISIISLETRKGTRLGEVHKVKRGYARYLIRSQKALPYDKAQIENFERMRTALEEKEKATLQAAEAQAEQLKALSVTLSSRAGTEGRLYGSLGPKEIATAITQAGILLSKESVHLPTGPIHRLGDHEVSIRLHDQVTVTVTIQVIPSTS